jgi:O-glycosyl hydrolase
MSGSDPAFDREIFRAYEKVKQARIEGNYQAIVTWMALVDRLLDERLAEDAATTKDTSGVAALTLR